jgi:ferritin-like metal-binding protein YciE
MTSNPESAAPGLESFWETCDQDGVADHPLMRELCFRLDAIQRYRSLIADAEASGNDEVVEVLSRHFDQQHRIVRRIREELARPKP